MKRGFALPVSGSWATPENIVRVARRAEELGYSSLWTFQRLLSPVDASWGEAYRAVLDPMVVLSYAAAVTSTPRLGVAVLNMPFVSPVLVAKQGATLDLLSGGRLDLGLGMGWSDEEYAATGATKRDQARRSEEFIAALRALWTQDPVRHEGEFYRIPPTKADPRPVQSHPPILLGGTARGALRRAGRLTNGWVSSSRADLDRISESIETVKQAAVDAGRDPAVLRFVCRAVVRVRDAGGERAPLHGSLEQIQDDIEKLAGSGLTEAFIDLNFDPEVGSPDADPTASMERAEAVLSALAPAR